VFPLGAAVYLPAHAVDIPFGTGRATDLSPPGRCLFSRRDVTYEGKRKVYEGLVLAILLYSSGCWCLHESEVQELRSSHHARLCPHNVSHFDVAC
jgi:hypothetical protein